MKIFRLTILALLFATCESSVQFEVPQPEGQKDERAIPKRLYGTYLSLKDHSAILITNHGIARTETPVLEALLSSLDSSDRNKILADSTFFDKERNLTIRASEKDSLVANIQFTDTLFALNDNYSLRKFKGYYFVSHQTRRNNWSVAKLGRTRHGIVLSEITLAQDIDNLKVLTDAKNDSVYNLKPTRRQMRKFVKGDGFNADERFVKVNFKRKRRR